MFGRAQTETITGANAAAAIGSKYFATVTSIAASGATAGNITAGTAVRFEPGQKRTVELVELAGDKIVYGFNALVMGKL